VYTLEVQKRGLHPYDDKRYLLDNLEDGSPNPYTARLLTLRHPVAATVLEKREADAGLVVSARPPRESIDKCKDKRYKRRTNRLQQRLAELQMAENESDWEYDGDSMPDGDAQGELHGEALKQAERAAAARPGLAVRMGDVIERLTANATSQSRDQPPRPDGARHWRRGVRTGDRAAGVSMEQPDIEPDENQENGQPRQKRRTVVQPLTPSPVRILLSPVHTNHAGTSGWHPQAESTESRGRPVNRSDSSSDRGIGGGQCADDR